MNPQRLLKGHDLTGCTIGRQAPMGATLVQLRVVEQEPEAIERALNSSWAKCFMFPRNGDGLTNPEPPCTLDEDPR
jgi:hypothetical protein